jgi:hypothetical protein
MIYSVLRRTLREGVTFDQFREAWTPTEDLVSVDFTVVHARSLADEREILSIGVHDMSPEDFLSFASSEGFAQVNQARHERLAPLVEETDGFLGAYEVLEGDHISL